MTSGWLEIFTKATMWHSYCFQEPHWTMNNENESGNNVCTFLYSVGIIIYLLHYHSARTSSGLFPTAYVDAIEEDEDDKSDSYSKDIKQHDKWTVDNQTKHCLRVWMNQQRDQIDQMPAVSKRLSKQQLCSIHLKQEQVFSWNLCEVCVILKNIIAGRNKNIPAIFLDSPVSCFQLPGCPRVIGPALDKTRHLTPSERIPCFAFWTHSGIWCFIEDMWWGGNGTPWMFAQSIWCQ